MRKTDYKYRSDLLRSGLPAMVNAIDKSIYADILYRYDGRIIPCRFDPETALFLQSFFVDRDPRAYVECQKINKAQYGRVKRLRDRINLILVNGSAPTFCTLTFRDDVLERNNSDSLRQLARRYISAHCTLFVGNLDFGAENGRAHYHFVTDKTPPSSEWEKIAGYAKFKLIRLGDKSSAEKLSRYVSKLTNHAIKETAARSHIIYSR